jgi:uncharacterized membrane protein YccC
MAPNNFAFLATDVIEALRGLESKVTATLDGKDLQALLFSGKTFGAALLALYLAFWLGLDDPRWSLLTVYVVSQPDSGLVLAKSFYRILGTIAGVSITIALVFALAQYGELFLASLAIWIGLCAFAARAARNFASYGYQLAGYTVAIVGLPAALNPSGAYLLIVARFTEIALGIGCAALVSRLIFPSELAPKLICRARELVRRADRFAAATINPAADRERLRAKRFKLVKDFGVVEAMRSSAYFESADARLMNETLRRMTHAAVDVCAVANEAPVRIACTGAWEAGAALADTNDSPRQNVEVVTALVRAADCRAVDHARRRLHEAKALLSSGIAPAPTGPASGLWSDPLAAALTGVRCALAVGITTVLWFATAWPNGPTAIVVTAVVCTLVASMEQPEKISLALAATVVITAIPVFVTQFYFLPFTFDFVSMSVALAPLMLGCGFIMAQDGIGPLGLMAAVYFAFASNIDNVMTYDMVSFFNSLLAILIGMGVSIILFSVFFPTTPAQMIHRFQVQLFARLSKLAVDRRRAVETLEVALYEQLAGVLAGIKNDTALNEASFTAMEIVQSSARAIGKLQTAVATRLLAPGFVDSVFELLDDLSGTYRQPSRANLVSTAWKARALRRRSLAMARDAGETPTIAALIDVIVGCEVLRSELLRTRTLVVGDI